MLGPERIFNKWKIRAQIKLVTLMNNKPETEEKLRPLLEKLATAKRRDLVTIIPELWALSKEIPELKAIIPSEAEAYRMLSNLGAEEDENE